MINKIYFLKIVINAFKWLLLAIITAYIGYAFSKAKDLDNKYNELITSISILRHAADQTFNTCTKIKVRPSANSAIFRAKMERLSREDHNRSEALDKIIPLTKELYAQKIITQVSYNQIKIFTHWNDTISSGGYETCNHILLSPIKLANWENNIIDILHKDRRTTFAWLISWLNN